MKPVAWKCVAPPCKCDSTNFKQCCYANYTAPRELSDDEIWELHKEHIDEVTCGHSMQTVGFIEFARAILKKASEK
jgi:hypothetical protein